MHRALVLVLLVLPLSGCASRPDVVDPSATGSAEVTAPWWRVGEWWQVHLEKAGQGPQDVRLVNFWNDTASSHFWLGVSDRSIALDHALHDTNPVLGRIHWGLLTPHESGIHAHGLFTFPTSPGDSFGGIAFGEEWEIEASAGDKPGALRFHGESAEGSTISYDYDPALRWFSFIDLKDEGGSKKIDVRVTGHGDGAKGAHWFLRGRDYYLGPDAGGTHDETFDVPTEDPPGLKTLALEIKGRATGPLSIRVIGPDGQTRHSETLALDPVHTVKELETPTKGEWRVSYTGTGTFEGTIELVGLVEYTKSI